MTGEQQQLQQHQIEGGGSNSSDELFGSSGGGGNGSGEDDGTSTFLTPAMPIVLDPFSDPPQLTQDLETRFMNLEHVPTPGVNGVKTYLLGLFRSALDTTGQTSHVPMPSDGGDFDSSGDASKARLLIPGGRVDKDTFEKILQSSTLCINDGEIKRMMPRVAFGSEDGKIDYEEVIDDIGMLLPASCAEAANLNSGAGVGGDSGGHGVETDLDHWCAIPPLPSTKEEAASALALEALKKNPHHQFSYWYNKCTSQSAWRDPRPGLRFKATPPSLEDFLIHEFSAADTAGTGDLPGFQVTKTRRIEIISHLHYPSRSPLPHSQSSTNFSSSEMPIVVIIIVGVVVIVISSGPC
jgi:hypothetical protein